MSSFNPGERELHRTLNSQIQLAAACASQDILLKAIRESGLDVQVQLDTIIVSEEDYPKLQEVIDSCMKNLKHS